MEEYIHDDVRITPGEYKEQLINKFGKTFRYNDFDIDIDSIVISECSYDKYLYARANVSKIDGTLKNVKAIVRFDINDLGSIKFFRIIEI